MQLNIDHIYLDILKSSGPLTPNSKNDLVPPHNGTSTVPDSVEWSATNIIFADTSSLQHSVSLSSKYDCLANYARMWVCGAILLWMWVCGAKS